MTTIGSRCEVHVAHAQREQLPEPQAGEGGRHVGGGDQGVAARARMERGLEELGQMQVRPFQPLPLDRLAGDAR